MKYTVKLLDYYATQGDTPGARFHPTTDKSKRLTFTTVRDARVWIAQRVASAMCCPGDWKVVRIRPKSKWISVSDRLPETDDYVICAIRGITLTLCFYCDGVWQDEDLNVRPVSHWQPLPDPPK